MKKELFDDITKDEEDGDWSQICKSCVEKHNINIDELDEGGGCDETICGIEGCGNIADYYVNIDNY